MDISIFEMIANAGLVVKFVMLCLFIFSVGSWGVIVTRHMAFWRSRKDSDHFLDAFWESKTLSEAYDTAGDYGYSPEAMLFQSGMDEMRRIGSARARLKSDNQTLEMQLAVLDNLKRSIRKTHIIEYEKLAKTLPFLATTASASPFIGLFGTVWGIMDAFQNIGMRGSASLAVVAPGIAEALIATAIGLAAAIPAVIFYNFYSNKLSDIEAEMEHFTEEFLNVVERDMLIKA
ncbi:MAG: protein TolQ [Desulfobulbaceae bacterium]|nr:protein TolQ [Desulfobulbaceae bacterium]